jgi:hypothetical protein
VESASRTACHRLSAALTEWLHYHDESKHLEVNIQRQRLARDRVAVAVLFDWNEVRVVARHEGDGARGVGAEELGETPLKAVYGKKDKNSGSILTIWGRSGSSGG